MMPQARPHPGLPAHFVLRRSYTLAGVFPLGIFLYLHVSRWVLALTGSVPALSPLSWGMGGALEPALMTVFIVLPLAFHAGYGLISALESRGNLHQYPHAANFRYVAARMSGLVALVFVAWHVYGAKLFPGASDPEILRRAFSRPAFAVAYAFGAVAAWFHFFNGIWTTLIVWGVTASRRVQTHILRWGMVAFAISSLADAAALARFAFPAVEAARPAVEAPAGNPVEGAEA